MKIILAVDILAGQVVHGYKGERYHYQPLDWGKAQSVIPHEYISEMGAKHIYLADLDRISGTGDNNADIYTCEGISETAFLNRGARTPDDAFPAPWIKNVVSTETCSGDPASYATSFDYFSVVVKDGKALPDNSDPVTRLREAEAWDFEGCVLLNLSGVGTKTGFGGLDLSALRDSCTRPLLYGGGVATLEDLRTLADIGFDGAIIATAVHTGEIPLHILQDGELC